MRTIDREAFLGSAGFVVGGVCAIGVCTGFTMTGSVPITLTLSFIIVGVALIFILSVEGMTFTTGFELVVIIGFVVVGFVVVDFFGFLFKEIVRFGNFSFLTSTRSGTGVGVGTGRGVGVFVLLAIIVFTVGLVGIV